MKNKLIVTAHDFGLCKATNAGIQYALSHKNNIITEIALLANAPGSGEAAEITKSLATSVSLNLNLTTFKPISTHVSSLVDQNGNFLHVDIETWNFQSIDKFEQNDIRTEIDAQVNWFIEHTGKKPSALLFRKNEHGDPKILIPLIEKAKELNIPVRTPVWKWQENYGAQSYVEQEEVKMTSAVFLAFLGWHGLNGFDLEKDIDKFISHALRHKGVNELLIPISFVDEELFRLSSLNWERAQFFTILDRSDVIQKIKDNFDLVSYRDL